MSEWTEGEPVKIPAEDLGGFRARERRFVAALIERANWISRKMLLRKVHGTNSHFLLLEFDAIVWALTKIVGPEIVTRWLGVIDKAPGTCDDFDEHRPSTMKAELPPEEPGT